MGLGFRVWGSELARVLLEQKVQGVWSWAYEDFKMPGSLSFELAGRKGFEASSLFWGLGFGVSGLKI